MQKLVYEGPDPERLLLDVWNEHGADALISEPERVARGGVFGFFAKTHYRVEVQPRPASSMTEPSAPVHASPSAALDALVDDIEDVYERPSIRKGTFDEVLAGVASSLGEDPATFAARGIGGMEAPPFQPAVAPTPRPRAEPRVQSRPEPRIRAMEPELPAPAPAPAPTPLLDEQRFIEMVRRERDEQPLETLRLAGFPSRLLSLLTSRGLNDFSLEAAFALLPPAPALPVVPGALIAVVGPMQASFELACKLGEDLDLPADEIACATPTRPAALTATTRSKLGASLTTADLAGHCIAPDLLVHDADTAAALSPGWRRDRVGIVAVRALDEPSERSWARGVLRALRASATIAITDARTKNEDLAHYLAGVGGVDALALQGAASTVTPAQLLALGLPVGWIDGKAATGANWASIVRTAAARRTN